MPFLRCANAISTIWLPELLVIYPVGDLNTSKTNLSLDSAVLNDWLFLQGFVHGLALSRN